jgi:glycosyltransferase involved in cell wall biosynthesis
MHVTTVDLSLRALLAGQLQAFGAAGFDVLGVSATSPEVAELHAAGIRHASIDGLTRDWTPVSDGRALAGLVNLMRTERPVIVHTHNPKSGVLGRLAARVARVPVIVNTVHGLYANPDVPPLKRFVADRSERWAMRASHHEFFQSQEDYRRALRERMVPAARASWLGNGVDVRRFDPANVDPALVAHVRERWGVPPEGIVIGTVGRLVWEKGYGEFIEAARRVRTIEPRTVFVAVGQREPGKHDGLPASVIEGARREGVVVHGAAATDEMPAIYGAMDLFVLASYREGMPRSAIEASAMRRAVIATNIRGCREVVLDGETGLLIPARDADALADAVLSSLADPARTRTMGERGRARAVERFDEGAVIDRTLAVYRRLMLARGIAPPLANS